MQLSVTFTIEMINTKTCGDFIELLRIQPSKLIFQFLLTQNAKLEILGSFARETCVEAFKNSEYKIIPNFDSEKNAVICDDVEYELGIVDWNRLPIDCSNKITQFLKCRPFGNAFQENCFIPFRSANISYYNGLHLKFYEKEYSRNYNEYISEAEAAVFILFKSHPQLLHLLKKRRQQLLFKSRFAIKNGDEMEKNFFSETPIRTLQEALDNICSNTEWPVMKNDNLEWVLTHTNYILNYHLNIDSPQLGFFFGVGKNAYSIANEKWYLNGKSIRYPSMNVSYNWENPTKYDLVFRKFCKNKDRHNEESLITNASFDITLRHRLLYGEEMDVHLNKFIRKKASKTMKIPTIFTRPNTYVRNSKTLLPTIGGAYKYQNEWAFTGRMCYEWCWKYEIEHPIHGKSYKTESYLRKAAFNFHTIILSYEMFKEEQHYMKKMNGWVDYTVILDALFCFVPKQTNKYGLRPSLCYYRALKDIRKISGEERENMTQYLSKKKICVSTEFGHSIHECM